MEVNDIIEGIARLAQRANPVVEGDYVVGDIYYCGKCKTPKQCHVTISGMDRIMPCTCECKKELIHQREIEEFRKRTLALKAQAFQFCGDKTATFDADDRKNERVTHAMEVYVAKFNELAKAGTGLLLYGGTGTGKTFSASEVVNALTDKGVPCYINTLQRMVADYHKTFDRQNDYLQSLRKYGLIVFDDFSSERKTEYMQEGVYDIINARVTSKLPFIVTTNMTAEQLKAEGDITFQRTYSRILEHCHPIPVLGDDRRKAQARENHDEMKALFGI